MCVTVCLCVSVCVHVCASRAEGNEGHFMVNSLTIHVELSAWVEGLSVAEVLAGPWW